MKTDNLHKVHRKESGELIFTINGKQFEWKEQYILGAELKKLADIPLEEELYLSIQDPWDDELITNETRVNLARPEIEHFYIKQKLKYTINGQPYESARQYVKGEFLRKQGNIPEDEDLYLKVDKPWEDDLINPDEWVDLARSGTEHFRSKGVEFLLIVDGREKKWQKRRISFEEVVVLAKGAYQDSTTMYYTVTYDRGPKQNPEGSMVKGDIVFVKNKMIFNVTATDKS
ncbi:MAG: multiubiquitin domain-containing protein [Chitinophagaceae bacterium]